jgi:threonine 3-dehydrogenase
MAVLVTGGTGLIGAALARLLLEGGEGPVALFDLHPSTRRLGELASRVEVLRGDVGTFAHVLDAVRRVRPSTIYHLGAMLSVPCEADPEGAIRANALGTFHVLEAARLLDVPQVLFASSIGTYGADVGDGPLTNATLQRPLFLYGATKLFGEHLGLFYRRTRGLDFRGVRFPSIVAPGVATPGAVQYLSWVIEAAAGGRPFTIPVAPETRVPILYLADAARALRELAAAPREPIRTAVYLLGGPTPVPSAAELAALIRARVPGARIEFAPDPALQRLVEPLARPIADDEARAEWGWAPRYGVQAMLDEFLRELRLHPERYPAPAGAA